MIRLCAIWNMFVVAPIKWVILSILKWLKELFEWENFIQYVQAFSIILVITFAVCVPIIPEFIGLCIMIYMYREKKHNLDSSNIKDAVYIFIIYSVMFLTIFHFINMNTKCFSDKAFCFLLINIESLAVAATTRMLVSYTIYHFSDIKKWFSSKYNKFYNECEKKHNR